VFLAAVRSSDFFQIGILPAIFLKERFKSVPINQIAAERNNTEKNPYSRRTTRQLEGFFQWVWRYIEVLTVP